MVYDNNGKDMDSCKPLIDAFKVGGWWLGGPPGRAHRRRGRCFKHVQRKRLSLGLRAHRARCSNAACSRQPRRVQRADARAPPPPQTLPAHRARGSTTCLWVAQACARRAEQMQAILLPTTPRPTCSQGKVQHYVFVGSAGAYKADGIEPCHFEGDARKASAGHVEVGGEGEEENSLGARG